MSNAQPESSSPSATMATTPRASTSTPLATSTSTATSPGPSNLTPTPTPTLASIDYRMPTPPDIHTVSRCLSDLHLSLSLATKISTYISHRPSLLSTLFLRQKTKDLGALKQQLVDVLARILRDGELGVEEFGKNFSSIPGKNRSKAFMMEVARCEGVKECIEYGCCQHIMGSEKLIRNNIIEPLSYALAHRKAPQYAELITETQDIHQATAHAIKESTARLKELVELSNKRLAGVPTGGEEWDDDYQAFAVAKKKAREEFARGLGM